MHGELGNSLAPWVMCGSEHGRIRRMGRVIEQGEEENEEEIGWIWVSLFLAY